MVFYLRRLLFFVVSHLWMMNGIIIGLLVGGTRVRIKWRMLGKMIVACSFVPGLLRCLVRFGVAEIGCWGIASLGSFGFSNLLFIVFRDCIAKKTPLIEYSIMLFYLLFYCIPKVCFQSPHPCPVLWLWQLQMLHLFYLKWF